METSIIDKAVNQKALQRLEKDLEKAFAPLRELSNNEEVDASLDQLQAKLKTTLLPQYVDKLVEELFTNLNIPVITKDSFSKLWNEDKTQPWVKPYNDPFYPYNPHDKPIVWLCRG
jgi:ribosome assembly protein YihI (activator of Der GTPase)